MTFKAPTYTRGTTNRRFGSCVKDQRHAVASRDLDQPVRRLGVLKFRGCANDLRQFIDGSALLVNRKLRITDDIDEQHMPDLERDLFC